MKASAAQVRAALERGGGDVRLFLLFGPDESGAQDLAALLARTMGPGAERVDLEPAQLRGNPGRLADEAAALSLFGDKRHIRVAGAGEESVEAVSLLLDAPRAGNPAVMIAPSIKAASKLAKLALGHPAAMALALYAPEGQAAEQMVAQIARDAGLRPAAETLPRIAAAAGNDRAVITREIEKLALFLDADPERPRDLDMAALEAVGADLGEAEIGVAVDAALDGRCEEAGAELTRLAETGTSPIPVLRALVRRLMTLAELRAEVDGGAAPARVVEGVFFRDRPVIARALTRWTAPAIARAIDRLRAAERATVFSGETGEVIAAEAMLAVARQSARRR
ncbi:DNA polymerase III subunit delta [Sphingomonas aracearum]|uniref:DNA-directed DNA polymerase n=1 Tax=Sphingomonas aracearum TaxID=2283317 RepID=A0A369VUV0_9SPHN|nr:DNA polymerase III subunit delta [Sphingomonas aracearum]RDE04852.1 DNA polymerase III subunit delta [Sphingomonas aracearum]